MRNFLFLLLFISLPAFAGTIVSGKDGSTETVLSVNTSGQVSTTLPAFDPEEIAASATDQTMGATGATGDYLDHCTVTVVTSATGTFGIEDGSNTSFDNISITAANTPIGVYNIDIRAEATTVAGWEITTGAGATAVCYGFFN